MIVKKNLFKRLKFQMSNDHNEDGGWTRIDPSRI